MQAAATLRALGGDVEVEPVEGGWRIQGYGCPLSSVVGEHPGLCSLTESLVESVVRLPARECCDRSEPPRCAFRVLSD